MPTKNWWFKFDFKLWMSDTDVGECSLMTRGFWLEVLCAMHAKDAHTITMSYERLARITRCESAEVARCVRELKDRGVANVTIGHGEVTVTSRRLQKALKTKENNKLRKQKERGHTDVTTQSNKQEVTSNPSSTEEGKPEAVFIAQVLGGVRRELKINKLSLAEDRDWSNHAHLAFENEFTPGDFLECLSLLRQQNWRTSAVTPAQVVKNLPELRKLRKDAKPNQQDLTAAEKLAADETARNERPRIRPPVSGVSAA